MTHNEAVRDLQRVVNAAIRPPIGLSQAQVSAIQAALDEVKRHPIHPLLRNVPRDGGYWVYSVTNSIGEYIYVGRTNRPRERMKQHVRQSTWADTAYKCSWVKVSDREASKATELEMIKSLKPTHNRVGKD